MAASGGSTEKTFTLEIVSPEKLLLSRAVEMAVIPGSEGEIGVLPGHAPMIVTLQGGMIKLYRSGQVTDRLFVGGGFAEITPTQCTVLEYEAVVSNDIELADSQAKLQTAEAEYAAADKSDIVAIDHALDQLQIARSRISASA